MSCGEGIINASLARSIAEFELERLLARLDEVEFDAGVFDVPDDDELIVLVAAATAAAAAAATSEDEERLRDDDDDDWDCLNEELDEEVEEELFKFDAVVLIILLDEPRLDDNFECLALREDDDDDVLVEFDRLDSDCCCCCCG